MSEVLPPEQTQEVLPPEQLPHLRKRWVGNLLKWDEPFNNADAFADRNNYSLGKSDEKRLNNLQWRFGCAAFATEFLLCRACEHGNMNAQDRMEAHKKIHWIFQGHLPFCVFIVYVPRILVF